MIERLREQDNVRHSFRVDVFFCLLRDLFMPGPRSSIYNFETEPRSLATFFLLIGRKLIERDLRGVLMNENVSVLQHSVTSLYQLNVSLALINVDWSLNFGLIEAR